MTVKEGRFGPYVTDGVTNASLRRGDTPETMTDARGNELLSERRAKEAADGGAPASKKSAKSARKTAPRKTVKRGAAKKAAAKKTTARKSAK